MQGKSTRGECSNSMYEHEKGIALTVIWNEYKNRKCTRVHCVIYEVTLWAENVNIEIHHEYINEDLLPGWKMVEDGFNH